MIKIIVMIDKKYHNHKDNPFTLTDRVLSSAKPSSRYLLECDFGGVIGKNALLRLGRSFKLSKLRLIKIFFAMAFVLLVSRLYWLQVAQGAYYQSLSDGNRLRIKKIEAKRGVIYDKDLNPLVHNVANFLLYFVPADLPADELERKIIFNRLAGILENVTAADLEDKYQSVNRRSYAAFQPLPVAENIEYNRAMLIDLEAVRMPGVVLSSQSRRQYLLPTLSYSHLLGYTGKINSNELSRYGSEYSLIDYLGKTGLEAFYENELKGLNGRRQVEVDAWGREKKVISQSRVKDGNNLVLSVDSAAQVKLEELLRQELKKTGLTRAVGIVSNPHNGEIISLVSLPTYNNNDFARGIGQDEYAHLINHPDKPLFFRAIAGEFPSGSTIKPVVLAAALQEGVVSQYTQFASSGGLRIGEWFFPDWKAGGHGPTAARKAIAESVNTYFYYISGGYQDFVGLGIEKMGKYFKMFGLDAQTGIDLPNEADGFLPTKEWKESVKKERWYIGDTYHVSIGQGDLLVTPLQVAYYLNYFANGGTLYRPRLVKYVLSSEDKLIVITDATPVKQNIIDEVHLKTVREGMRQAVTDGSARRLNSLPVSAAGKTGTAQWSSEKKPHAWFIGFAPYNDPEVAITILLEEGEEGSATAVAVADEWLRWYFGSRQFDIKN